MEIPIYKKYPPKLNSKLILKILQEKNKSIAWLAVQLNVSRQAVHHQLVNRAPGAAKKYALILDVSESDLIE